MAEITAKMVADLRAATGLGMMECKKALVETEGDVKAAEELLRIKSGAKASKLAGRTAAEGVVAQFISADGKVGALVEVNCETDFVGKDEGFVAFAKAVAQAVVTGNPADVEALAAVATAEGPTVEETRKALIAKLGENMSVRRFVRYETAGKVAAYLHGAKIGVLVDLAGGEEQVGKDVAMHIAASKPICVSKEQVPAENLETERRIYTEQAAQSGKPADIVAKMVEGRINKYLAEVTLLGQQFVKNPDITVEKLLKDNQAAVNAFTMFVVGEGIEKKVEDYAAEVAAAAAAIKG
ncbi:translation elongation factor Ts [Rivihabitans pingtungensis]|uniref:Elongation factor Ts n=1 Tax=Rivihabitans pingtungensis TaxID=1054498 RepID=A0A318KZD2_9NEIS|nr:translation elongation factor Ts [Rivihabitans pingtungensis]MCK6435833.1 translation elongation factor Ts [Rivihabitans pingtungensis]PXX81962.1 translation elongation factor Ts (EF-Ts) [Rivihabitans pingtungensis]HNX70986.1 translation elongation factor Ts [Rivihabitans pingtungensis]